MIGCWALASETGRKSCRPSSVSPGKQLGVYVLQPACSEKLLWNQEEMVGETGSRVTLLGPLQRCAAEDALAFIGPMAPKAKPKAKAKPRGVAKSTGETQ
eukprot:3362262-Amphidinium_carterae.1